MNILWTYVFDYPKCIIRSNRGEWGMIYAHRYLNKIILNETNILNVLTQETRFWCCGSVIARERERKEKKIFETCSI